MSGLDCRIIPSVQTVCNIRAPVGAVDSVGFVSQDRSHEGVKDARSVGVGPVCGRGGRKCEAGKGGDDDIE